MRDQLPNRLRSEPRPRCALDHIDARPIVDHHPPPSASIKTSVHSSNVVDNVRAVNDPRIIHDEIPAVQVAVEMRKIHEKEK